MPAPTQAALAAVMKEALLGQGFAKGVYGADGSFSQDPTNLPDDLQKIVTALAAGLSKEWAIWQSTTVVQIPITSSPGSPSTGIIV